MAAWLTALRWPRRRQSPESGAHSVSDGVLADEAAGGQLVNAGLEDGIEVHVGVGDGVRSEGHDADTRARLAAVARYLDEMISSAESETESVRAELLQEPIHEGEEAVGRAAAEAAKTAQEAAATAAAEPAAANEADEAEARAAVIYSRWVADAAAAKADKEAAAAAAAAAAAMPATPATPSVPPATPPGWTLWPLSSAAQTPARAGAAPRMTATNTTGEDSSPSRFQLFARPQVTPTSHSRRDLGDRGDLEGFGDPDEIGERPVPMSSHASSFAPNSYGEWERRVSSSPPGFVSPPAPAAERLDETYDETISSTVQFPTNSYGNWERRETTRQSFAPERGGLSVVRKGLSAVTASGRAAVPCLTFDTRGSGTGSGLCSSGRSLGSGRGGSRGGGTPHSGTRSPLNSGTRSPLNSGTRSPLNSGGRSPLGTALGGTLSARSAFAQKSRANPFGAPIPSPTSQRQANSFLRSAAHAAESHVAEPEAEDARNGAEDARDGAGWAPQPEALGTALPLEASSAAVHPTSPSGRRLAVKSRPFWELQAEKDALKRAQEVASEASGDATGATATAWRGTYSGDVAPAPAPAPSTYVGGRKLATKSRPFWELQAEKDAKRQQKQKQAAVDDPELMS